MAQDGKCPRCDFKAPMIVFYKTAGNGRMAPVLIQVPPAISGHYFSYISLFRPKSGCAVMDSKAERLTLELVELVNKGFVSQKGQVDRSCPPRIWGMAIEQMMERAGTLTLPIKTHGYLKTIAWDLANKENSGQEQEDRSGEARCQSPRRGMNPDVERSRRIAAEKFEKELAEWRKENADKLEKLIVKPNLKGMD